MTLYRCLGAAGASAAQLTALAPKYVGVIDTVTGAPAGSTTISKVVVKGSNRRCGALKLSNPPHRPLLGRSGQSPGASSSRSRARVSGSRWPSPLRSEALS